MNDAVFLGFIQESRDTQSYQLWECPACHAQYYTEEEAKVCCPEQTKELMRIQPYSQ